ncbi:deaminase [Amycolatopsis sp. WAC 01375]|uniref:dihydrofolate reductase family protein n=1 Tax=Amycolatopsis sp. WAC 01375 TaxID=2203194 RepID=UPI000F78C8C0|nr:dihydrofolate reductase family protein [Amycolatopsis sp. WAC 01375]RSM78916.1 deaminase [Amycolatopsis sp. WAC 01375]
MREIAAGLFMSLDGVAERPDRWMGRYWSDEMSEGIAESLAASDAILMGKDTYLAFEQMWKPQGDSNPMAAFLNGTHKYVVSSTLDEASLTWPDTSLITGDIAGAITRLKEAPGKTIRVPGSPKLVSWLLAEDLLDELALNIMPLVAGEGARLFDGVGKEIPLTLTKSNSLKTGVIGAVYNRAG